MPIGKVVFDNVQRGHFWEQKPTRDFVFFYAMGRMLNEYPASDLYNFDLQKKVLHEVAPLHGEEYTPNPYPPFVGIAFRPFTLLSYFQAYVLWLVLTLCFYVTGVVVLARQFFPEEPLRRSLILCLALSYFPFLWVMNGGQIPVWGFLSLAFAFREEDRDQFFRSGLALGFCAYKPTLLVLILPMLLITKRYRTLGGFAATCLGLGVVSTAMQGIGIWSGYLQILLNFGAAATKTHAYRQVKWYMDIFSFSALLPGGRSAIGATILILLAGAALIALFLAWRKAAGAGKQVRMLIWATTLTWTFVLNLYVPIYDSMMAVVAAIVTASVLRKLNVPSLWRRFNVLWIAIFVFVWAAVRSAENFGFEGLTVLFALAGMLQLSILRQPGLATDSNYQQIPGEYPAGDQ